MPNISSMFGIPMKGNLKEVSSPRLIEDYNVGIEVELEGLRSTIEAFSRKKGINSWWNVVKDGSLRRVGEGRSAEFVHKGPMFGQDVVDSLVSLEKLTKVSSKSCRTSVHVHLDVRDMSYNQLLRLLVVYLMVEPIIFDQVESSRKHNPYCTPIRGCNGYLEKIGRSLRGESQNSFTLNLSPSTGSKYTALNYLPIAKQGSIEFRHKEGTNSADDIINWVNLVLSLKRHAMNVTGDITPEEVCHMVDNYGEFVTDLFEGVDIPNLRDCIEEHEDGAGLVAKTLLQYVAESEAGMLGNVFEVSARDSHFWGTVSNQLRKDYFTYNIPKSSKKKKTPPSVPTSTSFDEVQLLHEPMDEEERRIVPDRVRVPPPAFTFRGADLRASGQTFEASTPTNSRRRQ